MLPPTKPRGTLLISLLLVSTIVLVSCCVKPFQEEEKPGGELVGEHAAPGEEQVVSETPVEKVEEGPSEAMEKENLEKRVYAEKRLDKARREVSQLLSVEDAEIFREFVELREKAVKSLGEAEQAFEKGEYEKTVRHAAWAGRYALQARQKLREFREIDPILVEMIKKSYNDLEAQRNRLDQLLKDIEENGPIVSSSIWKERKRKENGEIFYYYRWRHANNLCVSVFIYEDASPIIIYDHNGEC
ncbi:MAG: hypothetical protein DRO11_05125 [Methanobacteriota archaeon]|nr:MAG: hypothetical protein DRO11_05125 [Euryarchaeota archaeon]